MYLLIRLFRYKIYASQILNDTKVDKLFSNWKDEKPADLNKETPQNDNMDCPMKVTEDQSEKILAFEET